MSTRHLARSIVMQTLFEWDMGSHDDNQVMNLFHRNVEEFAPGVEDMKFFEDMLAGIIKKRQILDDILQKAAPEWPLEKISSVDRNVLRVGLYELVFGDRVEVPPKVAINEAIELAKTFGGENSGRFVNGVLGAVYKELGEPDKDQPSKKEKEKSVNKKAFPIEKKGGAVIFSRDDAGVVHFAMVHDVFGYWTLSKGGIDDSESEEEGTKREIKEELGLDISIIKKLGENEYMASHPEKGKIRKQVMYFLAESPYQPLRIENESGGLDDVRWFTADEIPGLNIYDDVMKMLALALEHVKNQ